MRCEKCGGTDVTDGLCVCGHENKKDANVCACGSTAGLPAGYTGFVAACMNCGGWFAVAADSPEVVAAMESAHPMLRVTYGDSLKSAEELAALIKDSPQNANIFVSRQEEPIILSFEADHHESALEVAKNISEETGRNVVLLPKGKIDQMKKHECGFWHGPGSRFCGGCGKPLGCFECGAMDGERHSPECAWLRVQMKYGLPIKKDSGFVRPWKK